MATAADEVHAGTAIDDTAPSEHTPLLPHHGGRRRRSSATVDTITAFPEVDLSVNPGDSTTVSPVTEDEEAQTPGSRSPHDDTTVEHPRQLSNAAVFRIICVLLLAAFVFNADSSLVLATHPLIASEFNALESSSWLFTSFGLAGTATQMLLGKLSDIYGRKYIILACYIVFSVGCLIVGTGQTMGVVILGRVVSGSVSAGMLVLVSILITDLIPLRDVATWRSYVNIAATTGRSIGGPLGGFLADVVGWRWSFIGQAPLFLLAAVLCWFFLPNTKPRRVKKHPAEDDANRLPEEEPTALQKLVRIDFLGAFLIGSFVLCLLLPLEIGGVQVPWSDPLVGGLFGVAAVLLVLIVVAEKRLAKDPILPLSLFTQRDVVASYFISALQISAQIGIMFTVPLYFQVTQKMSNAEAGAHLFPAVVGNAFGGILCGILIKKTGTYKWLLYCAIFSSIFCYLLLMLRWHGSTNWGESLYIVFGGFGAGTAGSATFVAIQAAVDPALVSPAVSTLYLTTGIGGIVGLAAMSATMQAALRQSLTGRLLELGLDTATREEILVKAISNVEYAVRATGKVGIAIAASYVDGLWWSHFVSLILSVVALVTTVFLREYKL